MLLQVSSVEQICSQHVALENLNNNIIVVPILIVNFLFTAVLTNELHEWVLIIAY